MEGSVMEDTQRCAGTGSRAVEKSVGVGGFDTKNALDCIRIADANLNVRALVKARFLVNRVALDKDRPNRVQRRFFGSFQHGMQVVDDGTVQVPAQQVFAADVFRQWAAGSFGPLDEIAMGFTDHCDPVCGQQVERVPEVDDGPDNSRIFNLASMLLEVARPVEATLGVCVPEVNALAEPVVIVFAWYESFATQHGVSNRLIASVITENE